MSFLPEITVTSIETAAIVLCALDSEMSAATQMQKDNPAEPYFLSRMFQIRSLMDSVTAQYAILWDNMTPEDQTKFSPEGLFR